MVFHTVYRSLRRSHSVVISVIIILQVLSFAFTYFRTSGTDNLGENGASAWGRQLSSPGSFSAIVESHGSHLPDLVIFRKSRKTGSSSMLSALIHEFSRLGYKIIPDNSPDADWYLRHQNSKPVPPSRFFVVQHNYVNRLDYRGRRVVILDTVRDGYQQITGFCRHMSKVQECESSEMKHCLESKSALGQITYRWTGRSGEDVDTYIDLPLSSAHIFLTTSILRSIFPDITLQFTRINVLKKSCPESRTTRSIYNQLYSRLDSQVLTLKKRMLAIAGYPHDDPERLNTTIDEFLDAADTIEKAKYSSVKSSPSPIPGYGFPREFYFKYTGLAQWKRNRNGSLRVVANRYFDNEK